MTREDTASVLKILKVSYPAFYSKFSKDDMVAVLDLWSEMFADDDIRVVKVALFKLIETHQGYPPDIAALKEKIRELVVASTGEPTDEELWQMLRRAASNGYYGAREEFDRLPRVVQRYLGSPSALRDLAVIDEKTLNTVTKGQFLKQIVSLRERQEFADSLPEGVKEAVARLYRKPEESPAMLTGNDFNTARNNVLNQLEGKTS
jgi:uncharacterized protein YcgL (UPF0745 family)